MSLFIKFLLSTYCVPGPGDPEVPKTNTASALRASVQGSRKTSKRENKNIFNSQESHEGSKTTRDKINCEERDQWMMPEPVGEHFRRNGICAQCQSNSLKIVTHSKSRKVISQDGHCRNHRIWVDAASPSVS